MKQISTFLKSIAMLVVMVLGTSGMYADVLLSENFDSYTAGNLIGQGSWELKSSSQTDNPIQLASPSLAYAGYSTAATGNSVRLYTTSSAGEDGKLMLGTPKVINTGESAYISMLVRPNSVVYKDGISLMTSFFTLMSGSTGGSEMVFLHAIPGTDDTKVKFSVGRGEANANYANQAVTTDEYNIGETYLIVIKYTAVDGSTNDKVELFVNPALDAEPTADASYSAATGSELGANGIKGIQLKQHVKYNASCADVTVDAIKVCTLWSDIKGEGGGDPEPPVEVPAITANPTAIAIQQAILSDAQPVEQKIKITAANIKSDITVSVTGTNAASVAVTPTTITPEQVAEGKEVEITATITPAASADIQECAIEFATEGLAANKKVPMQWSVIQAYNTLADFAAAGSGAYGVVKNNVIITAVEPTADSKVIYLQDDDKALKTTFYDATATQFVQGANLTNITLSFDGEETYYLLSGTVGETTGIEPKEITVDEMNAPEAINIYRLVKLTDAKFKTHSTKFSSKQDTMIVGEKTFNIRPLSGSDLMGTDIPAADKAFNVTGILTQGQLGKFCLQMRSLADMEEQAPTQPEEKDELLLNAGFETSKTTIFATEFEEWDIPLGSTTAETTDKQEGKQAMRVEYKATNTASLSQDVFTYPDYPTEGATYVMRIRYKIVSADEGDTLSVDSHWQHRTDGALNKPGDHDRNVLYVKDLKGSDWTTKEIETTCPAGATKFTFRLTFTKGMVVLFDDFSFTRKQATEPSLFVNYQPKAVKANIGDTAYLSDFIVEQAMLESDISVYFTGANGSSFFAKPDAIPAADGTTTVKVGFAPKTIGEHKAVIIFETPKHTILTKTISLTATAIDPQTPPTISINPTELPKFSTVAGTTTTAEITLTSASCIAPIDVKMSHQENAGFIVNGSQFPQNMEAKLTITFRPNVAGEYKSTLTVSSANANTITLQLEGTATAAEPGGDPIVRDFRFDWSNPLQVIDEKFDNAVHNKPMTVDKWQNVVTAGERPWWGFDHKDADGNVVELTAKATTYGYQQPSDENVRGTMWLTTPVLDFKNAKGKILTMRVMGDLMFEGHSTTMSVWLIDSLPADKEPVFSEIQGVGIPATPDLNGEWSEIHLNLEGQDIADAFAIGFKYDGVIGEANSVIYYLDDISWGRTDLPVISHDSAKIEMIAPLSQTVTSGTVTVTGKNLANNITLKLGGANPSNFELSQTTLPAEGGKFTVKFKSDNEGVHEAFIKLSSRGAADKYIPMAVLCKSGTVAVDNIEMDNVKSWTSDNTLHLEADAPVSITLITTTGQTIAHRTAATTHTITSLPQGTYIVRISDGTSTEHRKITL